MAEISKTDFLTCVKKSRVVDSDKLKEWLSKIDLDRAVEIAAKMVKDKLLTKWQAKYLLSGRSRLDIGSYRLLERLNRDELGDRFLAIHKQLGRKVNIQVLPSNLTSEKTRCDAFIKKASQAAKLDHPNLIHVFDIDQESGRYFLVTEHVGGTTLDQVPKESMDSIKVAKLVNQSVSALLSARESQVEHGDLKLHDLILTDTDDIKIQNMAVSPLRSSDGGNSNDFQVIAGIGSSFLKDATDYVGEKEQLKQIFRAIGTSSSDGAVQKANQQLGNWLSQNEGDTSGDIEAFEEGGDGGFDQPIASGLATRSRPKAVPKEEFEEEDEEEELEDEPGYIARLAKENPIALLATAAVLSLMLLGGTAWGAFAIATNGSNNSSPEVANVNANNTAKKNPSSPPAKKQKKKPKKATRVKNDIQTSGLLSSTQDAPAPDFKDTEAMQRKMDEALGMVKGDKPAAQKQANNPPKNTNQPRAEKEKTTPVSTPAPNKNENKADGVAANTAQTAKPAATATEPEKEPAKETPKAAPKKDMAKAAPKKKEPEKKTQQAKVDTSEPFKKFPRVADLPPITERGEKPIANLVTNKRYLLGASLFSAPEICKSRVMFELERTKEDKQRWLVLVKRRPKEKGTAVAAFRKSDTQFFFEWLPEAEDNKYSSFLRNCFVKLELPDQSHWLGLRKPIKLDPMLITQEKPIDDLEQVIEALPKLDAISIQVLPMQIKNVESSLDPGVIEYRHGLPARIKLKRSDANAFVWIQVNAELKNKLKAKAGLALLVSPGNAQPLELGSYNNLLATLKQMEGAALAEWEAAKKKKAPKGKGPEYDKWRAELGKAHTKAKGNREKAEEYAQLIPKFLGKPIRLRINAKMGGEHTIELVNMRLKSAN